MIRGTTPEITFNLSIDTSEIKSLYVTFADSDKNIILEKEKNDCTLSGKSVKVKLTQKETLCFKSRRNVLIQLRAVLTDNNAVATDIFERNVKEVLKGGVIE